MTFSAAQHARTIFLNALIRKSSLLPAEQKFEQKSYSTFAVQCTVVSSPYQTNNKEDSNIIVHAKVKRRFL